MQESTELHFSGVEHGSRMPRFGQIDALGLSALTTPDSGDQKPGDSILDLK